MSTNTAHLFTSRWVSTFALRCAIALEVAITLATNREGSMPYR